MRVVVTGASGYLGSEVARLAEARGWDVIGGFLTRTPSHGRPLRLDVRSAVAVESALREHDPAAVVHCAYVQVGPTARDTIVLGSEHVAAATRQLGARLVHMSTDVVFGGDRIGAYTEDDEVRPVSDYGAAKADAEDAVARANPEAVLVRTGLVYGGQAPGQHERLVLDALDAGNGTLFYTDEIRCPAVLAELAAALIELVELDVAGPLHVTGPDAVSRYEFARRIAAAHGRNPEHVRGGPGNRTDRPRNCALDCARARSLLQVRLRGVREVLP